MKCYYAMCNNLGECTEEHIKYNNKNYCQTCYDEMMLKSKVRDKILEMLPREPVQTVNMVIKDLVHTKGYECDYIIYGLENIKKNNKKLNYARGIQYYLCDMKLIDEYKARIINRKYKEMIKEDTYTTPEVTIIKFNNDAIENSSFDLI